MREWTQPNGGLLRRYLGLFMYGRRLISFNELGELIESVGTNPIHARLLDGSSDPGRLISGASESRSQFLMLLDECLSEKRRPSRLGFDGRRYGLAVSV